MHSRFLSLAEAISAFDVGGYTRSCNGLSGVKHGWQNLSDAPAYWCSWSPCVWLGSFARSVVLSPRLARRHRRRTTFDALSGSHARMATGLAVPKTTLGPA